MISLAPNAPTSQIPNSIAAGGCVIPPSPVYQLHADLVRSIDAFDRTAETLNPIRPMVFEPNQPRPVINTNEAIRQATNGIAALNHAISLAQTVDVRVDVTALTGARDNAITGLGILDGTIKTLRQVTNDELSGLFRETSDVLRTVDNGLPIVTV